MSHVPVRNKRSLDEESEDVAMETSEPTGNTESCDSAESKRTRTENTQGILTLECRGLKTCYSKQISKFFYNQVFLGETVADIFLIE